MVTLQRRNPAGAKMTSDQGYHRQDHIINPEPPDVTDARQRTQYHLCESCRRQSMTLTWS